MVNTKKKNEHSRTKETNEEAQSPGQIEKIENSQHTVSHWSVAGCSQFFSSDGFTMVNGDRNNSSIGRLQ